MNEDLVSQEEFDHNTWGALPIIVRGMYRVGCLLIKLLIFVVDLPAKRSSFGRFQTDPTYTPLVRDAY